MMVTARRLRSIGWMATLVVCVALVMVLAFRVNALRSHVHASQARIIALKQETMYLETEFETRANQQQLKNWNDVEFGYTAPVAAQYLDNERELASYAKPVEPDAPAPIRVASADDTAVAAEFPAMVSPMTGQAMSEGSAAVASHADDNDAPKPVHKVVAAAVAGAGLAGLGARLGTVHHGGSASEKAGTATHPARKTAGQKSGDAKAASKKTPSRAFAGRLVKAKDRLASAESPHHDLSARARTGTGTPLIRYALRDAGPHK